jgi:multidrug efflux pump subunit AcrB
MRSFRLIFIIGCVAVMSMGFGFAALLAFDIPFGFGAVVGLVGLTGVAINDSIVVLAAMHEQQKVRQGELSAACDVVVESTRHVLATSLKPWPV